MFCGNHGLSFRMLCIPSSTGSCKTTVMVQMAVNALDFYHRWTGVAQPLPKFDLVAVPGKGVCGLAPSSSRNDLLHTELPPARRLRQDHEALPVRGQILDANSMAHHEQGQHVTLHNSAPSPGGGSGCKLLTRAVLVLWASKSLPGVELLEAFCLLHACRVTHGCSRACLQPWTSSACMMGLHTTVWLGGGGISTRAWEACSWPCWQP